jgi:hypothetical protein
VVDVCSFIYGGGLPPTYIPSFTWGGSGGFTTYKIDKAFETINKAMSRRNADFSEDDKDILLHLYETAMKARV